MKKKGQAQQKKILDKIFSQYIRLRTADIHGMVLCYTCGLRRHWKEMQCSHFVPRQYLATRYDEINCQVGCYACNMLYNGQPSAFALRLEKDYGEGTVARLEALRRTITKDYPYESQISHYKKEVERLST